MFDIDKKLHGFHWQFPGGAESSYSYIVRKIQDDPRLSKKRKEELIEDVTYLVGHILSDADFMIRGRYTSAHSSGVKYLDYMTGDEPTGWTKYFHGEALKSTYMAASLEALSKLSNLRNRVETTAKRILNNE